MKQVTLKIFWSEKEQDFVVQYPSGGATGGYVVGHIISNRNNARFRGSSEKEPSDLWSSEKFLYAHGDYDFIEHSFIKEMESRGFDKKTLKFSIKLDVSKLKERHPYIYADLTKEQKKKLGIK